MRSDEQITGASTIRIDGVRATQTMRRHAKRRDNMSICINTLGWARARWASPATNRAKGTATNTAGTEQDEQNRAHQQQSDDAKGEWDYHEKRRYQTKKWKYQQYEVVDARLHYPRSWRQQCGVVLVSRAHKSPWWRRTPAAVSRTCSTHCVPEFVRFNAMQVVDGAVADRRSLGRRRRH